MIPEIFLKQFIAALFKNSVIKTYTDPLLKNGIDKLVYFFKGRKENVLNDLTNSAERPEELAEKHAGELGELLQDQTFRQTVEKLYNTPSVYVAVVDTTLKAKQDIILKLAAKEKVDADIAVAIKNSGIESTDGNLHIELNG